jgi:large subunit ribosomal protein L39e
VTGRDGNSVHVSWPTEIPSCPISTHLGNRDCCRLEKLSDRKAAVREPKSVHEPPQQKWSAGGHASASASKPACCHCTAVCSSHHPLLMSLFPLLASPVIVCGSLLQSSFPCVADVCLHAAATLLAVPHGCCSSSLLTVVPALRISTCSVNAADSAMDPCDEMFSAAPRCDPHCSCCYLLRFRHRLHVAAAASFCCFSTFIHFFLFISLQPSNKTFRVKKILAKKQRQNRPIPQWIRLRTDNTIRSANQK